MAQNPTTKSKIPTSYPTSPPPLGSPTGGIPAAQTSPSALPLPAQECDSRELLASGDPMLVLRALLKMPDQWRLWGFKLQHVGGLQLELRAGFARFTENSSVSFTMSL